MHRKPEAKKIIEPEAMISDATLAEAFRESGLKPPYVEDLGIFGQRLTVLIMTPKKHDPKTCCNCRFYARRVKR